MSVEQKKCPWCKKKCIVSCPILIDEIGMSVNIICVGCGYNGPYMPTQVQAIQAHNKICEYGEYHK